MHSRPNRTSIRSKGSTKTETHKYNHGTKAKHDFRWRPSERKKKGEAMLLLFYLFQMKASTAEGCRTSLHFLICEVAQEPKGCGKGMMIIRMYMFTPVLNHVVCWDQWMFNLEHLVEDPQLISILKRIIPIFEKNKMGRGRRITVISKTKALDYHKTEIKAIFEVQKDELQWWREV